MPAKPDRRDRTKYPRLGIDSAPSGPPAWRELPTHYLVAADDRALPAATQRELAARAGATTTEWATGHGPMYARPKELAAYLASRGPRTPTGGGRGRRPRVRRLGAGDQLVDHRSARSGR
ncbi:alpha/beta fold hydrolase [Streptomyces sp. NPDC093984]|uniref:alpha/beta fold hydrolase n=1 Tax=Streptomyces sp. NPDC093984 TaxID=3366052 RepID=UPI0037FC26A1